MPLTRVEKVWIANRVAALPAGSPDLLPECLAPQLASVVNDFRQAFPASTASDAAVKAAIAGMFYGPRAVGNAPDAKIPDAVIRELEGGGVHPGFAMLPDELACEWAVSRGCLRFAAGWNGVWQAAFDSLSQMMRTAIYDEVKWLGEYVGRLSGGALNKFTFIESSRCAPLIRGALLVGCDCWQRDTDFCTRNGTVRCASDHRLANWNPMSSGLSLFDFIWRAAVAGSMRAGMINAARSGILVRVIQIDDTLLRAGPILKCNHESVCKADVTLGDVCENGHQSNRIRRTTWWLWKSGDRGSWRCRRCMPRDLEPPDRLGCGLYFKCGDACPCCGKRSWSRDPTEVWLPLRLLPQDGPGSPGPDTVLSELREVFDDIKREPAKNIVFAELRTILDGDERTIAETIYHSSRVTVEVLQTFLAPPPSDAEFSAVLCLILRVTRHIEKLLDKLEIAYWQGLKRFVDGLPSKRHEKELAKLLCLYGMRSDQAASKLGMDIGSRRFKELFARIISKLRAAGLLSHVPDDDESDETPDDS